MGPLSREIGLRIGNQLESTEVMFLVLMRTLAGGAMDYMQTRGLAPRIHATVSEVVRAIPVCDPAFWAKRLSAPVMFAPFRNLDGPPAIMSKQQFEQVLCLVGSEWRRSDSLAQECIRNATRFFRYYSYLAWFHWECPVSGLSGTCGRGLATLIDHRTRCLFVSSQWRVCLTTEFVVKRFPGAAVPANHPAVTAMRNQLDAYRNQVATSSMVTQARETITGMACPIAASTYVLLLNPAMVGVPLMDRLVLPHLGEGLFEERCRLPEYPAHVRNADARSVCERQTTPV
jgi:hypothetical protein